MSTPISGSGSGSGEDLAPVDTPHDDAGTSPAVGGMVAGSEPGAATSGAMVAGTETLSPESAAIGEVAAVTEMAEVAGAAPEPGLASRLMRGGFAAIEEAIAGQLVSLRSWLPLALAIATGVGIFGWAMARGDLGFLFDNKLSHAARMGAVRTVGLSVSLFALFYGGVAGWRRTRGAPWIETFRSLNSAFLVLLALPLVLPLLVKRVEVDRPFFVLAIALALASVAAAAAYRVRRSLSFGGEVLPIVLLGLSMAAYAWGLSSLALVQHWAHITDTYDLGIYDNIFWQSLHGNPLGSSFVKSGSHVAAHVDPILVLLSPLYLLYPRSEFLLVFQSIWLALGAIPLYWLAKRSLGSPWLALGFAAIYLLFPALHGANLYDFHSLTLAAPLLIGTIAAIEAGRPKAYAALLALLLLTREDMALLSCFVGLYAIVAARRTKWGLATIGVSLLYFATLKLFVMPDPGLFMQDSKEAYGYAYYYKDLIPHASEGALGLVISLVMNPIFTLVHVFTEAKVLFALRLFLPLLFLPFLARGRIAMGYGIAFLFLSSRGPVHSLHFQYTVVLFPLAMAMAPQALAGLPGRRWFASLGLEPHRAIRALTAACVVATIVVSAKYGAILPNDSFKGGFHKLVRSLSDEQQAKHAFVQEAIALIPKDASVAATRKLGPHISNREKAFVFPAEADYLLLDRGALDARASRRLAEMQSKGLRQLAGRGTLSLWGPGGGAQADEAPDNEPSSLPPQAP